MRQEYVSYHDKATREAILNCYCHRDYNRRSNIKIDFFDDRCEIISPGGFYGGLTLEDALNGVLFAFIVGGYHGGVDACYDYTKPVEDRVSALCGSVSAGGSVYIGVDWYELLDNWTIRW